MKQFLLKVILLVVLGFWGTGLFGQAPIVTNLNPVNGATGVAVNQVLSITFDRDITPRQGAILTNSFVRVNNSFGVVSEFWCFNSGFYTFNDEEEDYDPVSSSVIRIENSNTLVIDLSFDLSRGEYYFITIGNRAIYSTEGSGTSYAFAGFSNSSFWSFTVLGDPEIDSFDPVQNATNVSLDQSLTLTFNQPINKGTGGIVQIIKDSDQSVFGDYYISVGFTSTEVTVSGNQLIINPQIDFEAGELYYVIIGNNAIDAFVGIDNSPSNNWRFTTLEPAPSIVSYDPAQGAIGVAPNKILTLTFDGTISKGSGGIVEVIRSSDLSILGSYLISTGFTSTEITISGNQLIINPIPNFIESEEYYVTIANGAINGFDGIDNSSGNNWRFTIANPPMEITNYNPIQNATNVSLDQSLTLTFNQPINKGTGGIIQIIRDSDQSVFGDYYMSNGFTSSEITVNGNQLIINPQFDFEEGELYYVLIGSNAINGFSGIDNSSSNNWRFTSLVLGPVVVSFDPQQDATGVEVDKILTLTFDKTISKGAGGVIQVVRTSDESLIGDYWVSPYFTNGEVTFVGNQLRINPVLNFIESEEYYVTIEPGAISGFGGIDNSESNNWRFIVANPILTVSSYDPELDAEGVPKDKTLTLTLSRSINKGTGGPIQIIKGSDQSVFGDYYMSVGFTSSEISVNSNQLIINPQLDFEEGELYYVLIGNNAIEGFAGIDNTELNNWRFTTAASGLVVVEFDPPKDEIGVEIDKVLTIIFDKIASKGPSGGGVQIIRSSDDVIFDEYWVASYFTSPEITVTGNQMIINPTKSFLEGEEYYVIVEPGAIIGFDGIDNSEGNNWRFTTIVPAEPPTIIENGLSPVPGSVDVSRNPVLSVTFNENILIGTASNANFRVFDSNNMELATIARTNPQVSVSGNVLTVSLTNVTLPYNTNCYVLIDPGFVRSAATGTSFPGISDTDYWYFTTVTAPPFWASGYPNISNQNPIQFTFNGQTDQNGIIYFVVTSSTTQPTAQQIREGKNHNGDNARIAWNEAMIANTLLTGNVLFNQFTPQGTNYYLYAVAYSGEKFSDIVRVDIDRTAPVINQELSVPANGENLVQTDASIVLVFSEKIYGINGLLTEDINAGYFKIKVGEAEIDFSFSVSTDGETVTLTPYALLLEDTDYSVVIEPLSDEFGNTTIQITRTFQTDKYNRWIGDGNVSNWTDPDNWQDGNYVPDKSVIILANANSPLIESGSINVNNFIIEPGASVIHTGGTITVNGFFNMQSSPNINASYVKQGGILSVTPSQVRIDQVVNFSNQTYIVSAPVSGVTKSSLGATDRMFYYDNPSGSFIEFSGGTMQPVRGYLARSTQNLVFSGALNEGEFTANMTYSATGFGWNLLGNPYTAAVNWDLLTKTESVENAVWMWKHIDDVYGTYSSESGVTINISDPWIPSNHGFFAKIKEGYTSGSITFKPSDMGLNTTSYLKSGSGKSTLPHIKLAGVNGLSKDETAIVLTNDAINGKDKYDAEKYFSASNRVLQLYTLAGSMRSAINGLPFDPGMEIPLGYLSPAAGSFSIQLVTNSVDNTEVLLLDKTLNTTHILSDGTPYTFTVPAKGYNQTRFALKINQIVASYDAPVKSSTLNIYSNNKMIYVEIPLSLNQLEFSLFDISGRIIQKGILLDGTTNRLTVESTGTYLLRINGLAVEIQDQYKVVVF